MAINKSPLVTTESENIKILNLTLDDFDLPTEGQKSKYPWVYWAIQAKQWESRLNYKKKCFHLGYTNSEEEAFRRALLFRRTHPFKGKSKYKGVFWEAKGKKWRAAIADKKYHMAISGAFSTQAEAARAYDKKAIELKGKFYGVNKLIWPEDFE